MSSVLCIAGAQAADVAGSKMVLTAYSNGAGGESLLTGQYDVALKEIDRDRTTSSLAFSAKMNNLCVAHAAKKQLTEAKSACDIAVRSARYDRISSQRYAPGSTRENAYVAIAYTNRAVVHAMSKDMDSAQKDLGRAKSLAPKAEFVDMNIAAMQKSRSTIAQLSVVPSR